MPRDLHEIARERVDGLSPRGRLACLVAAALSRPTRELILRAVAPEDDAGTGLLEAEEAGVLVTETGPPSLHTSAAGLGDLRLRDSRAATPAARGPRGGRLRSRGAGPPSRAQHDQPDEPVAAQLEEAAARAAKRGAQQAASELYTSACRLTPVERSEARAQRELGQAAALLALGDLEGSLALAEDVAVNAHTGPLRARALLLLGDIA